MFQLQVELVSLLQMELYSIRLKELEFLLSAPGRVPTNRAEMEATLRAMEDLMQNLQQSAERLTGQRISSCFLT